MKKGNRVVLGIFDSRMLVERAVDEFKRQGFRSSDISVLMPQMGDTQTFAHEKSTKAPEGATVGGGTGAVIGGAFGWLAGIGAIAASPALIPLIAAGPLLGALAGAAVGGAVGGVAGALVGYGIPEYEAKRYESFLKEGGILLSVHVDDKGWSEKAHHILEACGAHDIGTSTEERRRTFYANDETTVRF